MAGTNGRTTAQAESHARRAKEKADARRAKATGAAGWVAERAGDWSLEDQDLGWMEVQKYLWNPLMDYWFRMEIEGFEKLPEPPALLIGIHSGAPFVWDAWTVGFQWWRHFGAERPLHGTAHDALMAAPLMGAYFRKMGVLPAAPASSGWRSGPACRSSRSRRSAARTRCPSCSRAGASRGRCSSTSSRG